MRDKNNSLKVNYISIKEIDNSGKLCKKFEYVTNIKITNKNIEKAVLAGRKRWKVENEGHNVLKNQGYYFDHNYGHGKKHLSAVIATLILFSFLTHTILKLLDQEEMAYIFKTCHSRRGCFELLRGITDAFVLENWNDLYILSMKALEAT